jgi:hypothetical protein
MRHLHLHVVSPLLQNSGQDLNAECDTYISIVSVVQLNLATKLTIHSSPVCYCCR